MEIVLSVIGSAVAITGLQLTIMTKAVELNNKITRLEASTIGLVYMQREQTSMLQRLSHIEAVVESSNRIVKQVKLSQNEGEENK